MDFVFIGEIYSVVVHLNYSFIFDKTIENIFKFNLLRVLVCT